MNRSERNKLLDQIIWDYNVSTKDINAVLLGEKERVGHFNREIIFQKLLESYSWFTIVQMLPPDYIKTLLNNQVVSKLRSPALRQKYEFVQKRLHQIIFLNNLSNNVKPPPTLTLLSYQVFLLKPMHSSNTK